MPRNPVWPQPSTWREILNDLHWSLYDLQRRWYRLFRYEEAVFVGGPLNGISYPVPRDVEEWFHPTRDGDVRYVRLGRGVSLVASYWRVAA